ncbi:hypothetical protein GDO81_025711 [Engystomops pustulosus]|uniref:Uncharacterized protein n=1 Tax=Engystomops pustulosus TaxID=76066 RepID=A0AAV6YGX3_ENGPU|nr:hypothetical protein GDO81_025711 [Engystomops pustulosus]
MVHSAGPRGTSAQQRHLVDVGGTALVNPDRIRIHRRERAAGSRTDRVSKSAPLSPFLLPVMRITLFRDAAHILCCMGTELHR